MIIFRSGENMNQNFPKYISNNKKTYDFLFEMHHLIKDTTAPTVIFNMTNTKVLETNLLVIFSLLVNDAMRRGIDVYADMPDGKRYKNHNIEIKLFEKYTKLNKAFVKPRCVVGNRNKREVEDLLTKYLKELNLAEYDKVKTLVSELITNVKMHVEKANSECKGYIAAHYELSENNLYISIANNKVSILENMKNNGLIFKDDESAIIWALKRKNSTRKQEESGGIGLYLLRKYINSLGGKVYFCSGKACMSLDYHCYSEHNENEIKICDQECLTHDFEGSLITICIPYITDIEKRMDLIQTNLVLDLSSFMED